jgi:hypothetical protein
MSVLELRWSRSSHQDEPHRSQFYKDLAGPFHGVNRPG